MGILQRIKEIIKFSGLSTRAFAIKCGLNQPTLDKQLKGLRGLSLETTMGILYAFPKISSEWLLRGEGEMLKNESSNTNDDRILKLVDTIATLQDALNNKNDEIASLIERLKNNEK